MWYTPYVSERIAQDRIQDTLRELKRRQLISEALEARERRAVRTPANSVLGVLRVLRLRLDRFLAPVKSTGRSANHAIR